MSKVDCPVDYLVFALRLVDLASLPVTRALSVCTFASLAELRLGSERRVWESRECATASVYTTVLNNYSTVQLLLNDDDDGGTVKLQPTCGIAALPGW